jgi:hypothetical protein
MLSTSTFSVVYFSITVVKERCFKGKIAIGAPNALFLLFSVQHCTRGSRHRLLIRRHMATTIIEMFGARNVNDPTCQKLEVKEYLLKTRELSAYQLLALSSLLKSGDREY